MRTFASSEINIIDKPLDVWDEVGRNPINDEPVHLCDLTAVVRKYNQWTKLLPRVVPFYGKSSYFFFSLRFECFIV